jgi:serine/threonine protein kinase
MTVIGTLIADRFRLDEKVGAGGMSSVYRAYDPTL